MLILTVKTDSPEAEVGLFDSQTKLAYKKWLAHRELSDTIHTQIASLLKIVNKDWNSISGVLIYTGPGSFTGLRIGMSVAGAIAYAQNCPIVGEGGEDWVERGLTKLLAGVNQENIKLEYGAEANITKPKK